MRILSLLLLLMIRNTALGQTPFTTADTLSINNIGAPVVVNGNLWCSSPNGGGCVSPPGSDHDINFIGALWMSGYDAQNNLHIAAQTFRPSGNDYWPGPLDNSDTLTYASSYAWAKIWKVSKTDIQAFLTTASHTITNTPLSILTWPASGNAYAQGNGGMPLTVTRNMAPFVDLNGNGIYEPLQGEYPAIPGDQAMWWVFSDNGAAHNCTNGRPLGIEVHAMSYGYSRGTLIDNVVYYQFEIVNRSANNYEKFRVAAWDMVTLGWPYDSYIGFDSTWRMGIAYSGTTDSNNFYGIVPPQAGLTMVSLPGDDGTNYLPAGNFTYYNNDYSVEGTPTVDTEFNNYMRGKLRNGVHFTDDFQGAGIPATGLGPGPNTNYVYPGDPSDMSQWSECVSQNITGQRTLILASNDFTLNAGATQKIVLAFILADTTNGCPETSFHDIRILADTAWGNYQNSLLSISNLELNNAVKIYPNPAHDQLFLENKDFTSGEETLTVYNVLGQVMSIPATKSGKVWNIGLEALPSGLYYLSYRDASVRTNVKFVKE